MAKKGTNYEIIQRVSAVIDFILDGLSRHEIVQYSAQEWGINTRQTATYIAHANKKIGQMADKYERDAFNKIRARLERQYRVAVKAEDGHLARLLIQDMRKLYGFDKPEKMEFGGSIGLHPVQEELEKLSDKDLRAIAEMNINEEKK